MQGRSDLLLRKLDEFIRKYYKNQLLRGAIYATGILLGAFLSVILIEYFGQFNSWVRGSLFFAFVGAAIFVVSKYIVLPLLKLNRIGTVISYSEAARIIGEHFSNVQDKLLNLLQLQNNQGISGSPDLLIAGINQKIEELDPVPFKAAIDLRDNRRHLRYVAPLLILALSIGVIWPHVISRGTERLINYETYYEKEMPFSFTVQNSSLEAVQAADFRLNIKVSGREIPNEVFIQINNIDYKLEKDDKLNFHYTFNNIQATTEFQLGAAGHLTKPYTLKVLPRPALQGFNLKLTYPAYLNRASESITNTGDLQVPQGTKVEWRFSTRNTESLTLKFADSLARPARSGENLFSFSRTLLESTHYTVKASNRLVPQSGDSVSYAINVVPDQYPVITVSEKHDSISGKEIYFSGQIRDDYGFTNLFFHYKQSGTDSSGKQTEKAGSFPIAVSRTVITQPYYYFIDLAQFNLGPGDRIEYFFDVSDNDGVNGVKHARTPVLLYKAPTRDELNEAASKKNEEISKDIEESIRQSKQLQKEISDLLRKVNDKKQLGYEEKKKLEDLLKKQEALKNKIEEVKQEQQQNQAQQNQFSTTDENILEKQKMLNELFENVMTPEMKKLFDEMNKMLEKMDKNQVQEKLEELKLTNKDIEKELDRNLEAFKQLEVEQKMQNAIDKIAEIKEKQDQIIRDTEGKKDDKPEKDSRQQKQADAKDLQQKQDDLQKEMESLSKDLKELEQKNKELEEPNKLPDTQQKQEQISQDMKSSSEQLGKNNRKNAAKPQKDASQKLEEMQRQMEESMAEEEEQQQAENAQAVRQILENLLHLSFSQEALMADLSNTRTDNPKFIEIPKAQSKLKEDSRIIEDSLLSLAKRAPQIKATVNRAISSMNSNMEKTIKLLANRNVDESRMRMQTTMSSANELANLLNESLEEMQNQMKQQQKSKGQKGGKCKKPGSASGKNPSSEGSPAMSMRKLQEQLNQQLKEMKDAMEKGQKPGEKPGGKQQGKDGKGGMGMNGKMGQGMPGSEQFAKMAAQQEALRRQMEELLSKLKNKGKNPGGDIANMMEETEKDLVNKQLTNETMRRQQEILSKLLESEKAEREREQDEQRKSNEAKNENLSNPARFLEYKRLKEKEMELLNTVPPSLTPFYKEKVNNYFNSLSNDSN